MKLLICAALLTTIASCCSRGPCITPPPMETSEQTTIAASVAAQLAGAPATGSLSATYSSIIKDTFDKLADSDKALFLFLVAIECYLKDGKVGQEIAKGMAQTVQAKWASKQAATSLTARSKTLDQRSPGVAPRIHSVLKQVGLE